MSFSSWLNTNKTILVHGISVAGILAASIAKATGSAPAIAGISLANAFFHIGEGLAQGQGFTGGVSDAVSDAGSSLSELVGDLTGAKGAVTPSV